jgi:hypothetical protein
MEDNFLHGAKIREVLSISLRARSPWTAGGRSLSCGSSSRTGRSKIGGRGNGMVRHLEGTEKGKKDVLQEEEGTSPEQSEKQTLLASTTQTAECQ